MSISVFAYLISRGKYLIANCN